MYTRRLSMEKVSIILPVIAPTEELGELTVAFLRNLVTSTGSSHYELIIIDSGDSYNTEEMVTAADLYLHERTPTGFGHAVNLGIKLASHNYIVVIGNDVTVPAGWLHYL
jgi:glycosyltransferase involved in cell wall biosynthesis